jgi:hypothetical protein
MRMAQGIGFDFAPLAQTEVGKTAIRALMAGWKPRMLAEDPREAVLRVMLLGLDLNAFMTRREACIAAVCAARASAETRRGAVQAMAELGARGAQEGLNAVWTAWKLEEIRRQNDRIERRPGAGLIDAGAPRSSSLGCPVGGRGSSGQPFNLPR